MTIQTRIVPVGRPDHGRAIAAKLLDRHRGARRPTLLALVKEWWRRYQSRISLASLDQHMRRDIGLTYADAEREANKPFWVA